MLLQGKHPALEIQKTLLGMSNIIYFSHYILVKKR